MTSHKINELNFLKITLLFFKSYFVLHFIFSCFILLPFVLTLNGNLLLFGIYIGAIFYLGLFLSFILHEYLHIVFLQKSYGHFNVEIKFSWKKISILPKIPNIDSAVIIKVALYPLLILLLLGLSFIIVYSFTNIELFKFLGVIYIFHLINIIPPFGDGMMLIKGLIKKFERR